MIVAVAAAVVAVLCLVRSPVPRPVRPRRRHDHDRSRWWRVGVALVPPVMGGILGGSSAMALVVAVEMVLATAVGLVVSERRRRRARRDAAEIAHGCQVLAGQLRVGRVPTDALAVAAEDCPILRRSHRLHLLGGDLVRIWRDEADRPGRAGLETLAQAWQVSQRTGAAMERLLQLVAAELAREHRVTGTVEAELAGTRATARLLSVLPLVGVALGFVLGGDPVAFVVEQRLGQVCLVVAVALVCGGLLWVERIAGDPRTVGPTSGQRT